MLQLIKFNPRIWFLLGFGSCFLILAIAAYFQFVEELEPCPLCISQRIMVLITGIIFLIASIHNPKHCGLKIYSIVGTFTALVGASISIRHLWIQNLPPEKVPECAPSLEYMFENFPLLDTIKLMLNGTGECADILWVFLGVSIPGWTLVAFIGLALLSLLPQWSLVK
ncbi:MAG: disulfide bond formation protein B [Methylococcales symbiont of Iophon sp. n. MRB-2018]|nr:MAG: disulfide bond formation protein B [Methylococcales symbiont of Iophon sp. n. MRB-2018]KAF3978984.1 MAG: disulfide bond formation protein B [Methylococcales symbiont of Iophon sp. n. MRB-2018]